MGRQAPAQAGHDGLQELPALPARPRRVRATASAPALADLPPAAPSPPRYGDNPGTYARADLVTSPAAAAQARRLTRDTLARWHLDALTDDAQAIASELAANAITHAVPPRGTLPAIIFAVHHRTTELRIIVWDNGPGKPEQTEPGPADETGRGLAIIDHLTGSNWGWWPTPNSGGKVIWAALPAAGTPHGDAQDRPC